MEGDKTGEGEYTVRAKASGRRERSANIGRMQLDVSGRQDRVEGGQSGRLG